MSTLLCRAFPFFDRASWQQLETFGQGAVAALTSRTESGDLQLYGKVYYKLSKKVQKARAKSNEVAEEAIRLPLPHPLHSPTPLLLSAMKTVRAFNGCPEEVSWLAVLGMSFLFSRLGWAGGQGGGGALRVHGLALTERISWLGTRLTAIE